MDINNIKMVGVDKDTPLELREKVSFKDIGEALIKLKELGLEEVVILSTCHRSEIYFYSQKISTDEVKDFFINYFGLKEDFIKYLRQIYGLDAVEHIFRVACGLESMVVGEDQILSQVKEAIDTAQTFNSSGKILFKLFRDAVTLGKKARTDTGIKDLALSISYIAVKFVQEVFEDIKGKKAFVIGLGEMGQNAMKNLLDKGADVFVTNRTFSKAIELKEQIPQINIVPYEEKYLHIVTSDIVISATNAPHYTVNYDKFKKIYDGRKICMVDIALPRDIDPRIGQIEGVSLYTIDDLKKTAEENKKERLLLIPVIEKMVKEEVNKFEKWYKTLEIEPYIKEVSRYANEVCNTEFQRIVNKLTDVSEKDKENIKIALKRVANKMANKMITYLKENAY
ncbi:glutamyl-tRNA reductase [Thermoanaerobacter sp. X514]|uniref:glutamyl-tRNA reductase n=1 Tax=Thermoanaerobacter sp. (strain X514) TaxID=399726 RepID=UPI0000E1D92F|nr:glutamyl-tRNA reductase [Thermoanaerobacter sp. X514]ABY91633.1 Glutamyl-tRNA reductase [Thermoanaerobacter sp. X514]MDI3500559.1 glutamyl-tRNA reductase [Thermoanaerobacter sp.]